MGVGPVRVDQPECRSRRERVAARESEPTTVRRPRGRPVDLGRRLAADRGEATIPAAVGTDDTDARAGAGDARVGDQGAVGRPGRLDVARPRDIRIRRRCRLIRRHPRERRAVRCVDDVDLTCTRPAAVGRKHDPPAVRRPSREAIDPRGMRQLCDRARLVTDEDLGGARIVASKSEPPSLGRPRRIELVGEARNARQRRSPPAVAADDVQLLVLQVRGSVADEDELSVPPRPQ